MKKAWVIKVTTGSFYKDGRNDVTPALYPRRADAYALFPVRMTDQRVVRVGVLLSMTKPPGKSYPGWAVRLPGKTPRFARDGLNDVTPGLWPTQRGACAWWAEQLIGNPKLKGQAVRVWVVLKEL